MAGIRRVTNRIGIGFYCFMLKGESMKKGKGCQDSFNIGLQEANDWWEKRTAGCAKCTTRDKVVFFRPSRYQPAKLGVAVVSNRADLRYYKLANGDILDVETKTILSREALLQILNS